MDAVRERLHGDRDLVRARQLASVEELRSEVRVAGRLARPLRVAGCPTLMAADWLAVLRATSDSGH